MALFEWHPKFDLGVQSMNDEHQHLIYIMNELHRRNEEGAGKAELLRYLKALAAYTVRHFDDEERYMESIDYPGLVSHRLIHQQLLRQLCRQGRAYESAREAKMPEELFSFLTGWLSAHICGIDMKYGRHSRGEPIELAA